MQQWNQTCSVEIATIPNVVGELPLLNELVDLIFDYGAGPNLPNLPVPHWGQLTDPNLLPYADRYQNYAKWQNVYAAMSNNFTTRTFANDFSDRWQLTFRPEYMTVASQFLGTTSENNVLKTKIQVMVKDTTTNKPVQGADITITDGIGLTKAHGSTAADGTLQLTYVPCTDPETKKQMECSGKASKARYQDVYFFTPFQ